MRLRQLVLAARELEPAVAALRDLLEAPEPYRDPGVGAFGLRNAVVQAGSTFVEVVSPAREGTAVGRWLDRSGGDGGYMLMLDLPDVAPVRARLAPMGVRVVHELELPDVVDVHLHPKDVGGCLLAVDEVHPAGSWRWGGPAWTGQAPPVAGGLTAVEIGVADPAAVAARWRGLLGLPGEGSALGLTHGDAITFTGPEDRGITRAALALPVEAGRSAVVAGVQLDLVPVPSAPG